MMLVECILYTNKEKDTGKWYSIGIRRMIFVWSKLIERKWNWIVFKQSKCIPNIPLINYLSFAFFRRFSLMNFNFSFNQMFELKTFLLLLASFFYIKWKSMLYLATEWNELLAFQQQQQHLYQQVTKRALANYMALHCGRLNHLTMCATWSYLIKHRQGGYVRTLTLNNRQAFRLNFVCFVFGMEIANL